MDLVLFDLDNTLLAGDSDYEWAQFLIERGVLDRAAYEARNDEFFAQYKAGTLDIGEFLDFQLAPLARYPRPQLDEWHAAFMDAKIRPMISAPARSLVAGHLASGALCAVVTATNSFVTAPIARELGVPHLVATEPETRNGAFTGRPAGIPCFREGKVARLEEWLAALGRPLASFAATTFYSDSHNDLALLERVTHPVAVDPDDALRRVAASRGWPVISLR
ncbi:MAG: HAD family hydrolase [Burkholderiales bacterium]